MTDWREREIDYELSFLDDGRYETTTCADGVNADRYPSDYKLETAEMSKGSQLKIKMAPGGGYVLRLKKKK
jgi:alpha-glucosidase